MKAGNPGIECQVIYRWKRAYCPLVLPVVFTAVLFGVFPTVNINAATITVNSLNDSITEDAVCTLREAVMNANDNAATNPDCVGGIGDDEINFSVSGTIVLALGELTIVDAGLAGKLTISGPGADMLVLSGNSVSRVLMNQHGADSAIEKVTIADGWAAPSGGGIYNNGSLTINKSVVRDNIASDIGITGYGGGIYNNGGAITLNNSTIEDNGVNSGSGYGGGIYNFGGTLTVHYSTLRGNFTSGGGAIGSFGGTLTIYASTLDGNVVATGGLDSGGALYSFSDTVTINRSVISGNFAVDSGSGIQNQFGDMTIQNSTITDNRTTTIDAAGVNNNGTLAISNSTLVDNQDSGLRNSGTATLSNSIIANNVENRDILDCDFIHSLGNNLIGNASSCNIFGGPDYQAAPGDQFGSTQSPVDPLIGPLQDNGGPTQTHALLNGSPAIDMGNNALVPAGNVTDQRGFLRIVNGTVDIGAYEFGDGVLAVVDIKPGSYPNNLNLKSKGTIPVAILTTDTFDATQVEWESILFGPDGATESHGRSHIEDVDNDGDMDAVLHFETQETGIACGDEEAMLTGETFGGQAFAGTDSIKTMHCS